MFHEKWARTSTWARRLGIALCGLALGCGGQQVRAAIPASERAALVDFYNSTNGAIWTRNDNWLGPVGTECSWFGVFCDQTQSYVSELYFDNNNLTGSIGSLDGLANLKGLFIYNNNHGLSGTIPPLNSLRFLQYVGFLEAGFTGPIPEISKLNNLLGLAVQREKVSGSIPNLSNLRHLKILAVSDTLVSGSIPDLGQLRELSSIHLYNNNLQGQMPDFTGLSKLKNIYLHNNHLSGQLPDFSSNRSLQNFRAENNEFSGSIFPLFGLKDLRVFDISNNQISGEIPSLSGATALETFNVSGNELSGRIPPIANLPRLATFSVSDNKLSGPLPALEMHDDLLKFNAASNHLVGGIPPLHNRVLEFIVDHNQLTGTIPAVEQLSNLRLLWVDDNYLTGPVPSAPPQMVQNPNAGASLCPNYLEPSNSTDWDALTGLSPWYQDCSAPYAPGLSIGPVSMYVELLAEDTGIQMLMLGNDGLSDVHWTLHVANSQCSSPSPVPWISLGTQAGAALPGESAEVAVTLQTGGLATDTYSAMICVDSDDADHPEVEVPITLVVVPHEPNQLSNPTSFSLETIQGNTAASTLTIANAGNADLHWALSKAQSVCGVGSATVPWIQVDAASGTTTENESDEVGIAFDAGSLSAGIYTASICIESDDPDNADVTLPVTFTVHPSVPIADVVPAAIELKATAGSIVESLLSIGNSGAVDLHWTLDTAEDDCTEPTSIPWIVGALTSGSVHPDEERGVPLEFDATAIRDGVHSAMLCLATDDPERKTISIPVTFTVGPPPHDDSIFDSGFELPHGSMPLH